MSRLDGIHVDRLKAELRDAEEDGRPCKVTPMVLRTLLEALENEELAKRQLDVTDRMLMAREGELARLTTLFHELAARMTALESLKRSDVYADGG